MESLLFVLLSVVAFAGCHERDDALHVGGAALVPTDSTLRVMTFNIRYDNPGDGEHAWPHRKARVASVIRFHGADLVGVQEALQHQVDTLAALLPGYAWFGVGRDDGAAGGEFSPVFYRADRFEVVEQGTFWLSETPDAPGSRGWDAALPRIVTWGRLRDLAAGTVFYLFNTHFDHQGRQAREESARLLVAQIAARAGDAPVVVTGDFNAEPSSETYRVLVGALADAREQSETPPHGPEGTFAGFTVGGQEQERRIDYVFTRPGARVLRHGVLTDHWKGRYPSDHLPVLAEIAL